MHFFSTLLLQKYIKCQRQKTSKMTKCINATTYILNISTYILFLLIITGILFDENLCLFIYACYRTGGTTTLHHQEIISSAALGHSSALSESHGFRERVEFFVPKHFFPFVSPELTESLCVPKCTPCALLFPIHSSACFFLFCQFLFFEQKSKEIMKQKRKENNKEKRYVPRSEGKKGFTKLLKCTHLLLNTQK